MSTDYSISDLDNKVFPWALRNAAGAMVAKFADSAEAEKVRDLLNTDPVQLFQMMIVDKPAKVRGKPVTTMYAVVARSRDEAIALFDAEWGAHHREMSLSWSCSGTQRCVVRAA